MLYAWSWLLRRHGGDVVVVFWLHDGDGLAAVLNIAMLPGH